MISSRITIQPAPLLSVIVPTFKERDNVAELVRRLHLALVGVAWEVIFVDDDSPDGTADVVRALALTDARVRCVQRIGRRGLSSACVEGMLASSAPYLCVMDGDLQHDETILPDMLGRLTRQDLDIVVGSRYVAGGAIGDWAARRPHLRPGGWAFQYNNDYYPDVDDTAVVAMVLDRSGDPAHQDAIGRAREWVEGMQSSNGGWGAFDPENEHYHLNHIPFADHGAMLDPPTVDVSARCISFLAQLGQALLQLLGAQRVAQHHGHEQLGRKKRQDRKSVV